MRALTLLLLGALGFGANALLNWLFIYGFGWGIAGFCPGPALAGLVLAALPLLLVLRCRRRSSPRARRACAGRSLPGCGRRPDRGRPARRRGGGVEHRLSRGRPAGRRLSRHLRRRGGGGRPRLDQQSLRRDQTIGKVRCGAAAVCEVAAPKRIRRAIAAGTAVEYRNPYAVMRRADDTHQISIQPIVANANLAFREAF